MANKYKKCTKCKKKKPLSKFYKNSSTKDGYRYWCIECSKKYNNDYKKRIRSGKIKKKKISQKECSKCGEIKDISKFYKDRSSITGYSSSCKKCDNKIKMKSLHRLGQIKEVGKYKYFKKLRKQGKKRCSLCNKVKSISEFYNHAGNSDGLTTKCIICTRYKIIVNRCKRKKSYVKKGIDVMMSRDDLEKLWFRDGADKMKEPEIHRKDSNLNYSIENCVYVEKDKHRKIHTKTKNGG